MSRTAGRILGWLMICEPPHQSAAGVVEALQISAGSVSTQMRLLEQMGVVERHTFPGDRASYYRLPDQVWAKSMAGEFERVAQMRSLGQAAVDVIPRTRPERVTELGLVAEFWAQEWPGLMQRLTERISEQTAR